MTREQMLGDLKGFVVNEFLDGRDSGLDEHTPLLEWGVIDSISASQLVAFSKERFDVEVPQSELTPQNLQDLESYASMLERLGVQVEAE
jgi:acyl carrier protein